MNFLSFGIGFFLPLSVSLADASWVLFAVIAAVRVFLKKDELHFHSTPLDKPILAFVITDLLASFLGLNPFASLRAVIHDWRFVIFYLLVFVQSGRHGWSALKGFQWGVLLAAVYGLLQFPFWKFIATNMPDVTQWIIETKPGWKKHVIPYVYGYRVQGTIQHMSYGEALASGLILASFSYLQAKQKKEILLRASFVGIIGSALLFSMVRGAWIGAGVGLICLFFLHSSRKRLIPIFICGACLLIFNTTLKERASSLISIATGATEDSRTVLIKDGAQLLKKYAFVGVGPRQIKNVVDDPQFPLSATVKEAKGDLHNQYLQQWVEKGILGLFAILWLFFMPLKLCWTQRAKPEFVAFFSCLAAFATINFSDRAFQDAEAVGIFWILSAIAVVRES